MATDAERAREILASARTIAVLGASANTYKPAYYVPDYLSGQGYRVLSVNPLHAGDVLFEQPVRASLRELAEPVDVVDVFRRSEHLPAHVEDILGMQPRPKVVWFQSGIVNDVVAKVLEEEGIEVVQDRCTYADHRRFGLPAVSR